MKNPPQSCSWDLAVLLVVLHYPPEPNPIWSSPQSCVYYCINIRSHTKPLSTFNPTLPLAARVPAFSGFSFEPLLPFFSLFLPSFCPPLHNGQSNGITITIATIIITVSHSPQRSLLLSLPSSLSLRALARLSPTPHLNFPPLPSSASRLQAFQLTTRSTLCNKTPAFSSLADLFPKQSRPEALYEQPAGLWCLVLSLPALPVSTSFQLSERLQLPLLRPVFSQRTENDN